jgi:3-methylcrotonyl-CoA carboxylase alpha subunit
MKTLLVANRGEIARRIFRTANALGLRTVAVYSEADRSSAHVADADESILIGPASARESYLDEGRVLDAAISTGADAIHPGYGFLAESAEFAEAIQAAGLIWIGPEPASLRDMGDKLRSREIAEQAGVPVVPGSRRFTAGNTEGLASEAEKVGFPLLVKASAGGGGIGMRRVDGVDKLEQAVTATQSMAAKAFGDGTVFLERFVAHARHIEIQVFGFGDGEAIHLFERDCSLQRRFQKVIEESPAPSLPTGVRKAMADAALALCRATRYSGAGTVEFIVDAQSFEFYFLEMNTRIQVEHSVTEMVVGCDLVAMQIEHARGNLPHINQSDLHLRGHAIECRLYAENPAKMFMPSPGIIEVFDMPEPHSDLRIESGYRAGDTITPHYDPMLAKIIVHGPDRVAAYRAAIEALEVIRIEGIRTNRDFLIACLESEGFQTGSVHTGYIEDNLKALVVERTIQKG